MNTNTKLASILRALPDDALVERVFPPKPLIANWIRDLGDDELVVFAGLGDAAPKPTRKTRKPRAHKPREIDPVTSQVLARITAGGANIVQVVDDVGINRARAHRVVNNLVADGKVTAVGRGRATSYRAAVDGERAEFANGAP